MSNPYYMFMPADDREELNKEKKIGNGINHHFYTIKMTERDDLLIEYYNESMLNQASIKHDYCYGKIGSASFKTYKILYCERCNFRIEVPFYIRTLKELKEHFEKKDEEETSREELMELGE